MIATTWNSWERYGLGSSLTDSTGCRRASELRVVGHEPRLVERAHSDFLAMVIHDIRNPLAAVRGFAQLMRRRGTYDARTVEMLIDETDRISRLLRDLQDATSIEASRLLVSRRRADLVSLTHTCIDQEKAIALDHTVTFEAPVQALDADVDPDRVQQIVQNLLSNAINYTSDGGRIDVRIEVWSRLARVSVRDDGIGIAPEVLPSVFNHSWRGAPTLKRAVGLGLGLFIARELVEAHGGQIWAQSDGPGRGSTFTFSLPLA